MSNWRFELGKKLGEIIRLCFEVVAALDDITYEEAVDEWVSTYVADRIINETDK